MPAAPASPGAGRLTAAELKDEHWFWHAEWQRHTNGCEDCLSGLRCPVADYQATVADEYGRRWQAAEQGWPS